MSFLFGGGSSASKSLNSFKPANVSAGGLNSTFNNNTIGVTSSPDRQGLVSNIADSYAPQASFFADLLSKVAPGFSDLRASRLAEIENARQQSIGDLRDNLARRRVLGSSFAGDALTRANLDFAQEKEKAQAESMLQEIDMSQQLAQQQFAAQRSQFQTRLDEMNLQADLATQLSSQATSQLGANARLKAQLDAASSQGAGSFLGTLGGWLFGKPTTAAASTSGLSGTGGLY